MILADTSVWIDNLRDSNRELQHRVEADDILCHATGSDDQPQSSVTI